MMSSTSNGVLYNPLTWNESSNTRHARLTAGNNAFAPLSSSSAWHVLQSLSIIERAYDVFPWRKKGGQRASKRLSFDLIRHIPGIFRSMLLAHWRMTTVVCLDFHWCGTNSVGRPSCSVIFHGLSVSRSSFETALAVPPPIILRSL
jgi:hypothetical protein